MTVYQPFKIALSAGQQDNLREAVATKTGVTLRLNPEQFGKGDPLPLTSTHIGRIKKAAGAGHGIDLKMSKAQLTKLAQSGGNLFSTALSLALPLLAPAAKAAGKALATAGLSFGAEKRLKKIFGNGYGPREVQLYQLVQSLNPAQKKKLEQHLVGKGLVRGGGSGQYGGFLGMLTSMFGKGMHVRLRRSAPPPPPPPRRTGGKGMHVRPPPFFGSWDDKINGGTERATPFHPSRRRHLPTQVQRLSAV